MDEVLGRQPRRMDTPAFENCHPVLHPQEGLRAIELRQQEPGPTAVARVYGEQFGEGGLGGERQSPTAAQLNEVGAPFARAISTARDQGQVRSHTTHNAYVLLLFFIRRLGTKSQSCDSAGSGSV